MGGVAAAAGAIKNVLVYAEAIPHKSQRYPTVGDWQFLPGGLHVSVSDTHDRMSNLLVALHEVVEAILCEANGVEEKAVDEFDIKHPELLEPGQDPKAPYHRQHMVAEMVERMVALQAGVNWEEHCKRVDALFVKP